MMNFLKHKILVPVVALCAAAFCVQPLFAQKQADTLSFWLMDNGLGSQKTVQKIVKKFQKETGVAVNVRQLNWGQAFDEISKAFEGKAENAPDVLQLGSTWVAHFAAAKKIRSVDFMMDRMDSSRFFAEGFKNTHIADEPGSYSAPWFLDVRALYANERLWNDLGIQKEDVDSYPQFLGVLRGVAETELKTSKGEPVAPFGLPGKDDWTGPQQMAPFVWSYGGDFIARDSLGLRSALLDSNTLFGLAAYLKVLGDAGMAPYSLSENSVQNANRYIQARQLFLWGTSELIRKMAFSIEEGGLKTTPIAEDGIMVVPPPAGPAGRISFVGGSHLAMPVKRNTSKYALAENLFMFLLQANNIDAYSRSIGFLPADKSIVRIWNLDERYSTLVESLENGRAFPNIPEWGTIESVLIHMSNEMGAALSTTKDPSERRHKLAELIMKAHADINQILKYKGELPAEGVAMVEGILVKDIPEVVPSNLQQLAAAVKNSAQDVSTTNPALVIVLVLSVLGCVAFTIRRYTLRDE